LSSFGYRRNYSVGIGFLFPRLSWTAEEDVMTPIRVVMTLLLVLGLAGCQSYPIEQSGEGVGEDIAQEMLADGITHYEDGNYSEAARLLQSSLDQGLSKRSDRVKARKHLAFIYCSSGRQARCVDEFRRMLMKDPAFNLAASEAGHPMWGPVFQSVKVRFVQQNQ
jgi:hypothetical protein